MPAMTTNKYNKYATIFEDDSDEDESDEDNDANGSIAYQFSNGFKKTPKVAMTASTAPSHSNILTMKKVQSILEAAKKTRPPDIILGSYLKPPTGNEFDGDGSFKRRTRRPVRKHIRDQMAVGSELNTDISPMTYLDLFSDRPTKRRASYTPHGGHGEKRVIPGISIPSISTAATSAQDLSKRVNYNYHPIIDFFGESVPTEY